VTATSPPASSSSAGRSGSTLPQRRQRVLTAAVETFHQFGFHGSSMAAIAAAADLTASALYRHYKSKQDMLATVIDAGTALAEGALDDAAATPGSPGSGLDRAADGLAAVAVEHRHYGAIIQRDMRHLAGDDRVRLTARWHELVARLAALVGDDHPDRAGPGTELVARAMFAVAASPSYHRLSSRSGPAMRQHREWLAAMMRRVSATPVDARWYPAVRRPMARLRDRPSRRGAIMAVATRLFAERGFQGVNTDQIAELSGVTVPTLYSHFKDKVDVMVTAQARGTALVQLGLERAFELDLAPRDRFAAAMAAYARFGVEHTDQVSVLVHEMPTLPEPYRSEGRGIQQEYVRELMYLLRSWRPELDDVAARILVQGALGLINELTRTSRYLGRPALEDELSAMAMDVCTAAVVDSTCE
jgi:AcrR family transcriptional regulator